MKSKKLTRFFNVGFASCREILITCLTLAATCLLSASSQAQSPYEGDLEVSGSLGVGYYRGSNGEYIPGYQITFEDAVGNIPSIIRQLGTRWNPSWVWEHKSPNGIVHAMFLDAGHALNLYNGVETQGPVAIRLDPSGVSTFSSGININGSPVLTQATADTLNAPGVLFWQGNGALSTAMGESTNASEKSSTAMGYYASASGRISTAMDHSTKCYWERSDAEEKIN